MGKTVLREFTGKTYKGSKPVKKQTCEYCGYEGSENELENCCDEAESGGFNNQINLVEDKEDENEKA